MRKVLYILLCLLLLAEVADAQVRRRRGRNVTKSYYQRMQRLGQFSYTGGVGISSYYGDLKETRALWAKPSIGVGVNYRATTNLYLRGEVLWYRISGADNQNDEKYTIYDRNLSFRADNFEFNVNAQYYWYNKYSRYERPIINPYGFLGVGITTNTPKAEYNGEWHSLRPLETEGNSYSPVLFSLPIGLGLTYHDILPRFDLSLEFGYRFTFSDYMDDVSTVYKDKASFDNPLAAKLSDRRDEFAAREGREARYLGNLYRGNPSKNDGYMITALKVTYAPGPPQRSPQQRKKYRRGKF